MYILQLSDLHINDSVCEEEINRKLKELLIGIESSIKSDDYLVCCILGDIIDRGCCNSYEKALNILRNFISKLEKICSEDKFKCYIVPGNHDICCDSNNTLSIDLFNDFVSNSKIFANKGFSDGNTVNEDDFGGYHFVCLSSVINNKTEYGEIDFLKLSKCNLCKNTIMLVHHSLVSSDDNDSASIRSGYELQTILEDNSVITLLHGHTHGFKRYTVGNDCQVIGVGPMFKVVPDISNQCNLIHISGTKVSYVRTFLYQADRNTWDKTETYTRKCDNNYYGNSAYELYEKILDDVKADSYIFNLKVLIKQDYDLFHQEIKKKFTDFLDDAKKWQSTEIDDTLEYTHGNLMSTDYEKWYDFVVRKLQKNPTNKRTLIPLINKQDVYSSDDEKLVSFDVVQFGFEDEAKTEFCVTIYMRALEVRYFLPINICEIYIMIAKIKEKIQSISNINICIFAFRAEQKLDYACYKKKRLDSITESKLCALLSEGNFNELGDMLREKQQSIDTVIDYNWIYNLKNAFKEFYKKDNSDDALDLINQIERNLKEIEETRLKSSYYNATESDECRLKENIGKLIDLIG